MAPKHPLSSSGSTSSRAKKKRKRQSLTLEQKMDILDRYEQGQKTSVICHALGLGESTLRSIRDNADKVRESLEAGASSSMKRTPYIRSPAMSRMEKMLAIWIKHQNKTNTPVSRSIIQEKARSLFTDINNSEGEKTHFKASSGWLARFKKRHGFHNIEMTEEAAPGNGKDETSADDIAKKCLEESYKKRPVEPTSSVLSPFPNAGDEESAFSDLHGASAEESDVIVKEEPELVPSPCASHETYMKEDPFHSAAGESSDPECDNKSLKWNQDLFMECENDPLEIRNQFQEANGIHMEIQEDEPDTQTQAIVEPDMPPSSLTCSAPATLECCFTVKGQHSRVGSSAFTASSGANDDTENDPQRPCRKRRQTTKLTPEQERDMVEWLQDHPLFYNKKLSDYKNVAKKRLLLEQKAHELNTYVNKLQTWKDEMSVRFECLFDRSREGDESKFSQRDKWIYSNFQFLREHVRSPTCESRTCDISLQDPSSSTGRASAAGFEQQSVEEQLVHDPSPQQAEEALPSTSTTMTTKDKTKPLETPITAELLQKLHDQHDSTNELQSQVASLLHPRSSHARQVALFMGYLASLCETMTTPAWRLFEKEVQAFAHDLISNPPVEPPLIPGLTPRTIQRPQQK